MQSIGLGRYALVKPWLTIVVADRVNDRARSNWAYFAWLLLSDKSSDLA